MSVDKTFEPNTEPRNDQEEAHTCIALGAGVGLLGATSAALTGAFCPLCVVVAPGLIGYGAYKKWKSSSVPRPAEDGDPEQS